MGYDGSTERNSSTCQRKFNFQDKIWHRETLDSDNSLIKELPEVVNVNQLDQLREQLRREEKERSSLPVYPQSETEYQSRSEEGLTLLNESQNN